ncbi:hypothetical protein ABD80_04535 [Bacillus atrophaeus]|uniref:Uncharacterized protein n=1 Tax=Bacillus atrophaeus (strain 1942) TaxID=720555 RepID=A0ABM5LUD0_BACA1|nr:hypothetical protein BATR1942_02795 [Bacillus atrophaeus 1942]AMR63519.1 hypothetical protein A1D11_14295 [Bacillus subtilis subsp. globigii]EIM10212.1 hypothetical protein UY9_13826 [Bacillus atrophaeus C89]MBG9759079.1 hypothetical protein [Bacillus atrophaeus]MDR4399409.1 hypothetical protein [Bacillus atrophaeus]
MVDFILLLKAWLYSSPYTAPDDGCSGHSFYEVQRRADCKFIVAAIGSGGGIGLALLCEALV